MSSGTLNGKVALVTGGSRGIGAAIAKKLAAEGARVALSYSASPQAAEAVVSEIKSKGGDAVALKAEATDSAAVSKLVNDTVARFGGLDILVNNAGVATFKAITDMTDADYEHSFDVNVRAVFTAVREAAKHMKEGGRIITIGSVNGERMPMAGGALYAATKFAVQGFTRGWSREFGPKGITVNVVQPGPIDTDMNPADGDFAKYLLPGLAIPRYGKPVEVADLVAFLASPAANYITGAAINIDGGFEA